jgi:hypothetical protein
MMVVHGRRGLVVVALLLVASTFGCVRPKPENQIMRLGDDVLAAGSAPTIYDSVAGDAILAGGNVNFSGSAGGDYVGAGGQQEIAGRVHGSLRAAGGHVSVRALVDRNATIGGGSVVVDSASVISHNAYLIGGSIRVEGAVKGGLLATGGSVVLDGPIGGDVEISGGSLRLGPRAQIGGSLRYRVAKDKVQIDRAAHVSGTITALPVSTGWGAWHWLWMFGGLLAGAIVVLLLPRFIGESAEVFRRRPLRAAVVGFLGGFLFPIAIIIAAITVIGFPLALLLAALLVIFAGLSGIPAAVWLGELILHDRTPLGRQSTIVNFFLGALIVILISIVPVLGPIVVLIFSCLGFGSILVAAWSSRERQLAA